MATHEDYYGFNRPGSEIPINQGLAMCCAPVFAICTHATTSMMLWCQEKRLAPPAQDANRGASAETRNQGGQVVDLQPLPAADIRVPADSAREQGIGEINQVAQVETEVAISELRDLGNGTAVVTYADGSVYEGAWEGKRHGTGKMTWRNGNVYQGSWRDNLQEGRGLMTYWDGSRYNGEWQGGKRHGKGEMTWLDGERYGGTHYQGEWRNDKREGKGLLRDKYEGTFEGDWKDDRAEGFGKATWRNGNWYQGGIYDGKPEGRGTFFHAASGRAIPGNFRNGKKATSCLIM